MPRTRPVQTNFSRGEWSDVAEGRVDLDQYFSACRTLENFTILHAGAAKRRPGTRFVAAGKSPNTPIRLLKFRQSTANSYVLEFGEGYIRFYKNNFRLENPPGTPVEVSTPYVGADLKFLRAKQVADVLTLTSNFYAPRRLERYSDSTWKLRLEPFAVQPSYEYGQRPNGTLLPSGTSGSVTLVTSVAEFEASDVGREIIVISGPSIGARATITAVVFQTVATATTTQDFTVSVGPFALGTLRSDPSSDFGVAPSRLVSRTFVRGIEQPVAEGRPSRFIGLPPAIQAIAASDWKMTDSPLVSVTPSANKPVGTTCTLTTTIATWRARHVGMFVHLNGGVVEIQSISTNLVANGIIRAELTGVTAASSGAWSLEESSWSSANGFPACQEFYQERHYYAATLAQPRTIWGSKVDEFDNFANGSLDDDAVDYTLSGGELDAIQWIQASRALLLGTSSSEFVIQGATDAPITPTNIQALPETSYGSTNELETFRVSNVVLFPTASRKKLREMTFTWDINGYVAPDLTLLADHLTRDSGFKDIGYQREPTSTVWAPRDDGTLCGMTYLRDQNVVGWHRQVTGSVARLNVDGDIVVASDASYDPKGKCMPFDGFFESQAVIPHMSGDREQVWLLVRRVINGVTVRYIEYLDDATFVYRGLQTDCAKTYDGTGTVNLTLSALTGTVNVVASGTFFQSGDVGREIRMTGPVHGRAVVTAFGDSAHVTATVTQDYLSTTLPALAWGVARSDLTGLSHLEGATVQIVGDGAVQATRVVTAGAVTSQYKAIKIEVGLLYESLLESIRPEINIAGSSQGVMGRVSEVTARIHESLGCELNGDQIVFRTSADPMDNAPRLVTADVLVKGLDGYDVDKRIVIAQRQPLPLTVLLLTGVLGLGQ